MNKEYLKENNLYEAHKQFMRLCEWSFVSRNVMEDDDEEQNANMGGDMSQQDPMQGGNMPMGNDPMMGGEQAPMQGGEGEQNPEMGGDMNQQDPMQGGNMPMGDDPMMGGEGMGDMPPMDDPMMGGEGMGEDEEVIDVEELTDAQEKMNSKVNVVGRNLGDVDDKIETLMQSLSKMEQMINNNNAEIAAFKQEFEKRNPTQTEKLNLRSLDSYPFNVNPKEYWEEKGIDPNSNYSGEANNDKSTTQEFVITNSDVDQFDNKTIEDSFNIDDDLQQSIEKIFNLK
jgi:hypothetical protein